MKLSRAAGGRVLVSALMAETRDPGRDKRTRLASGANVGSHPAPEAKGMYQELRPELRRRP